MTRPAPVNLAAAAASIGAAWSPRVVATVNELMVKVFEAAGEFTWHEHADTDELFLVLTGELTIQLADGDVVLGPGDLYVVPRGVRHCPRAIQGTTGMLLEPAGVVNTADAGGALTAPVDQPLQ